MKLIDEIEVAKAFAKVEELSKACQQHLFENAVDLGEHELVIHALLNSMQDFCSDWVTPLQNMTRQVETATGHTPSYLAKN